jgi:hypothetical protein
MLLRKITILVATIFCLFSCAGKNQQFESQSAAPYQNQQPYYNQQQYLQQLYAPQYQQPYTNPGSRFYSNPYAIPPSNYYPHSYDSDHYYKPPNSYGYGVEQHISGEEKYKEDRERSSNVSDDKQ